MRSLNFANFSKSQKTQKLVPLNNSDLKVSLKFATSGGLELEAQWAGRQSEGLVTAFALHYSWVNRRKGSVHRIYVGVAGGGQSYSARSGWPKKRPMLRFIGLRVFARAVSPPYVRSWFWLGTSKAQTHLIRHRNYLQP